MGLPCDDAGGPIPFLELMAKMSVLVKHGDTEKAVLAGLAVAYRPMPLPPTSPKRQRGYPLLSVNAVGNSTPKG
jgi:hypothetical protein